MIVTAADCQADPVTQQFSTWANSLFGKRMTAPFYASSISEFIKADPAAILGILTLSDSSRGFRQQLHTQTEAWSQQISILQSELATVVGDVGEAGIVIEFPIPRRTKRVDAAIVCGDTIIVFEFKVGASHADSAARDQAEDYCLDLRDFHLTSAGKTLVPVVIPTLSQERDIRVGEPIDNVTPVIISSPMQIGSLIRQILPCLTTRISSDIHAWAAGAYRPTPTIIEAACNLYSNMEVFDISQSQAEGASLHATTMAVFAAVQEAQRTDSKVICFVTGVPGAGKTLAGLNIVHNQELRATDEMAVFLSGNGPLIEVLREALARDASNRSGETRSNSRRKSATFIQNVHDFLKTYGQSESIPPERLIVFDEAQRAWNAAQSMAKFKRPASEPEMMLEAMERIEGWAALVCLIGGGQEINTGEGGLPEWGRVLETQFPAWRIVISDQLVTGAHTTAGEPLFAVRPSKVTIAADRHLHLSVSMRSYRAEVLSEWVAYVLSGDSESARRIASVGLRRYPLFFTRELDEARRWINRHRRGQRRSGVIASSGARRLRHYGIDVTTEVDVANWFLAPHDDVRSSSFLEVPGREFTVQGLELDWACVCWGADLRRSATGWDYLRFRGTAWTQVHHPAARKFVLNRYRVLLTRAREGMVIWLPRGSAEDPTRLPSYYSGTAEYLRDCGVAPLRVSA